MWPLYVLLSKFSRTEEEYSQGSGRDRLSLVESFLCKRSVGTNKCHNSVLSCSYFCEVPHINQLHSWDCGLACVLMVLRTLGMDSDMQELEELCCTTRYIFEKLKFYVARTLQNIAAPVSDSSKIHYFWSIRHAPGHIFGESEQLTLGANPSFCVETFYKEQLSNDLVRVDVLFQKARDAGIYIECRSISSEEISSLIMSGKFIAIALVDQYKLSHSWLEDIGISDFCNDNPGYTGHYVVICGYDADTDEFEIRDPASSRKHEKVTSRCLEGARKSFGTDEDLLLIRLQKEDSGSSPL